MGKYKTVKNRVRKFFWQIPYKYKIRKEGGQKAFVMKRVSRRAQRKKVRDNLILHTKCFYSVHNGLWCNLPCLWCQKHKPKERS